MTTDSRISLVTNVYENAKWSLHWFKKILQTYKAIVLKWVQNHDQQFTEDNIVTICLRSKTKLWLLVWKFAKYDALVLGDYKIRTW